MDEEYNEYLETKKEERDSCGFFAMGFQFGLGFCLAVAAFTAGQWFSGWSDWRWG